MLFESSEQGPPGENVPGRAAILCCFPTFLVETSPEESEDLAYFPDPATDSLPCPAKGKSFGITFSSMGFNFSPVA